LTEPVADATSGEASLTLRPPSYALPPGGSSWNIQLRLAARISLGVAATRTGAPREQDGGDEHTLTKISDTATDATSCDAHVLLHLRRLHGAAPRVEGTPRTHWKAALPWRINDGDSGPF
jgi:hypothetical protein